jgi:gamma-glutamylcyclotransferase (GGCT)/AIG2-like uncharacterized protein YtfP
VTEERLPVFTYGTLKPGGRLFHHISHAVRETVPASICGRLYDTPFGYPLLLDAGNEECPLIAGTLIFALDELYEEMLRIMDVIELEAGFERGVREVFTESGRRVRALVYFYREAPRYAHPYEGSSWE